ncbi:ABC transporter permease [Paenibacillus sp. SYP-B4298]|uniref:ABC transporter permease n=1 Tax=Paenibacillus sp. SYP-B4298 TaxID=2996034 RepID=UPI0022DD2BDD|nr:ABC transporter permease [Paenibacillus sp. SYP-B4298]
MMHVMLAHARMELKLFFREAIGLFFVFVMPAICCYIFGQLYGTQQPDGLSSFDEFIPGMLGIIVFTSGFFIIGLQIVSDREKGVYKRFKGTAVKPSYMFQAIMAKGFFAVYAGSLQIVLLAKYMFDAPVTSYRLQFWLALSFAGAVFMIFGFVMASIAKRLQGAMALSFIAMYPMLFLSGATIPVAQLPPFLQALSTVIPLKYAIELMQSAWRGELFSASSLSDAIVLWSLLLVGIAVVVRYFRWDHES